MKIKTIGATETVMSNPYGVHNYFGWSTAARLKNGKIAVSCSGFRLGHVCPFGKAVMSLSDDDGESFSPPSIVIDTPLDDRDSGLCPFGESGLIITTVNNSITSQKTFRDSSLTEEELAYAAAYYDALSKEGTEEGRGRSLYRISNDNGVSFGPLLEIGVNSPHGPIELRDGSILWVGRANPDFGNSEDRIEAHVLDPKTGTSKCIGFIEDIYDENGKKLISCEPYAFETEPGRLICHIRTEPGFSTYQATSNDGGVTWSAPKPLLGPHGGAASHIMRHSSGVLVASYSYREKPYGIKIMLSSDNGESWDVEHRLYTGEASADLGYPSTVELADGSLLTVFYARTEPRVAVILKQRWKLI